MNNVQQRKLDSLIRVQDFLARNRDLVGGDAMAPVVKQVDDAVSQVRQHITSQVAAGLVVSGQTGRVRGMSKNLVRSHLGPIAKFARASLKGVPEYATLATTAREGAPKTLVTHAYAVAEAAKPYITAMTAAGFPADTIDHLVAATNELNETIAKREPLAAGRVQSTEEIVKLIELGRDGVRKIDAVLAKRLASDAPALASWKAASRVQFKVGSVRKPALMESVTIKPENTTAAGEEA
jgi:hypothetical protein